MRKCGDGHKNFSLVVGAITLILLATACGGGGGGSSSPPGSPSPEPPSEPPPTPNAWTPATAISSASGGADDVDVAMDAAGNVLAVWRQADSGVATASLWASRYVTGSGWSAPVELDSDVATVDKFSLAMQPDSGRATVVWTQLTTSTAYDIWARTFDASGWGAVTRVESQAGMVSAPSVGIDANGNSVSVWSQVGNFRYHVWASRHVPGSGWNTPVLLETLDQLGRNDTDARVAVFPSGDAQVVWQRSDGTSRSLWVNNFTVASGWGSERELVADLGTSFSLSGQQLALDGSGGGLLVWGQWQFANGVQQSTIASKRFAAGWQNANSEVAPPVANDLISHPRLALNSAGTAAVAWVRKDLSLIASVATAGGPWGQATALKPADSQTITGLPDIALDDAGNGFAVWDQRNSAGSFDIWLSRYTPAAGWAAPARHEDSDDPAQIPVLAINARGDAVVAWIQLFPTSGSRIVVRYFRNP